MLAQDSSFFGSGPILCHEYHTSLRICCTNSIFPKLETIPSWHFCQLLLSLYYIYRPQRSWGKVMVSQECVILFTGGVCLSACWDTTPPGSRQTPRADPARADTRPGADTPWSRCPPEQTSPQSRHPSPRSRHPPGADPQSRHPPGETPPRADTPPAAEQVWRYSQRAGVRILLECNLVTHKFGGK